VLQQFFSKRPEPPAPEAYPVLRQLYSVLTKAEFTYDSLMQLFPDTTLTGRNAHRVSAYKLSAQENDTAAHSLALFWLLREPMPKEDWYRLMGRELVDEGVRHGLIRSGGSHYCANFDIQPCLHQFVLTDPKFRLPEEDDRIGVYYLGSDSYGLVNTVPRETASSALDIFTGSGVHALLAATHCSKVVGVDINPRAVSLATSNAGFNGFSDRCHFLESDLFSAVEGQTFDLITANPPFVPTPAEDLALYRSGGETGEFLTSKVLKRLHEFLNPGGMMAMVTNYPMFGDIGVIDHHFQMLEKPEEFGIALLHSYAFSREMYIQMHFTPTGDPAADLKEQERWLESYRRNKIKAIGFGVLFFCHLESGHSWSDQKNDMNLVGPPLGKEVGRWLKGLRDFGDGGRVEGELSFCDEAEVYVEQRTGKGFIRWEQVAWPEIPLTQKETDCVLRWLQSETFRWDEKESALMTKLGREGVIIAAGALAIRPV
jgi:carbamoyltransferase